MREALLDLDEALKRAGGRLFLRRGDPVAEAMRWPASAAPSELHVSADYSAYARAREQRLAAACEEERIGFHAHPGVTIVPPGAVAPGRRRSLQGLHPLPPRLERGAARPAGRAAAQARAPSGSTPAALPALEKLAGARPRRTGRGAARARDGAWRAFLRDGLGGYDDATTTSPATAPRGSAPTSASAASRRWR